MPALALLLLSLPFVQDGWHVERVGTLDHPPLAEVSGITRSSHDGLFWVHNDGDNPARLFAVDATGAIVVPDFLREHYRAEVWPGLELPGASNVDWEDLTSDGDRLFVADLGNNGNARRDLGVWVLPEPNPRAVPVARPLAFWPVAYPDQEAFPGERWHFDCEAVFVADGKLHVLTKHRRKGEIVGFLPTTRLYRLDTTRTDEVNLLTPVGPVRELGIVTAADLSPEGERLAVLTYTSVWIFERPEGEDWLAGRSERFTFNPLQTRQVEAVTWKDGTTLLVANEARDLFEVRPPEGE